MVKFRIQRRRLVTQLGTAIVDVPEGIAPIDFVNQLETDPLSWIDVETAYLSIDVAPEVDE